MHGSLTVPIAEGDQGTEQTITQMRRLIWDGLRNVDVNRLAVSIVYDAPAWNTRAEAKAIYSWIRKNIRFTGDIAIAETLRTVEEILAVRAGDCDCINGVLLPTLMMSVGIETRLVTVAAEASRPESFSHIYPEVNLDGVWTPVDAAAEHAAFGKEPGHVYRKTVWDLETGKRQDLKGWPGLGQDDDDGVDWSGIAQAITAGSAGAASLVKAINTPAYPLPVTYTTNAAGQLVPVTSGTAILPGGSAVAVGQGTATVTAQASATTSVLFGGVGLLLLLLFVMR